MGWRHSVPPSSGRGRMRQRYAKLVEGHGEQGEGEGEVEEGKKGRRRVRRWTIKRRRKK